MAYYPNYYGMGGYGQQYPRRYQQGGYQGIQPVQPIVQQTQQAMQGNVQQMQGLQPLQVQQMQPQAPQSAQGNVFTWVLNETEANSYAIDPGTTIVLWDKNQPTIYIKSMSLQGVPSFRTLDFVERLPNAPKRADNAPAFEVDNFVTKDQFEDLRAKFDRLTVKFEELQANKSSKGNNNDKSDKK